MTNISNDPSNDAAIQAIEDAIHIAAQNVCHDPKVNLENFDPLTQSSHNLCGESFDDEIKGMNFEIFEYQDIPYWISYAGTRGWLNGYSCARDEANPVISNQAGNITRLNRELSDTQNNLTQKTKEANKLEVKLESKTAQLNNLRSTEKGELYRKLQWAKYCCWGLVAALAVAIVIIIIDSQMMG